jgi:hypothetical protein
MEMVACAGGRRVRWIITNRQRRWFWGSGKMPSGSSDTDAVTSVCAVIPCWRASGVPLPRPLRVPGETVELVEQQRHHH